MGKIIVIANAKGGVGKTTTTINLGDALSRMGRKVLLVDVDPQRGNLTRAMGYDHGELKYTLTNVMAAAIDFPEALSRILEGTLLCHDKVDLLPATKNLGGVSDRLVVMKNSIYTGGDQCVSVLRSSLLPIRDQYDYIIIDCAPQTDMLLINALAAADEVIIPVQAEFLAGEGIPDILETVCAVRNSYNPTLKVAGILITLCHTTFNLCKDVRATIMEVYGRDYHIFEEPISYSVRVAEHPVYGESIISYEPKNPAALAYQALAREVAAN